MPLLTMLAVSHIAFMSLAFGIAHGADSETVFISLLVSGALSLLSEIGCACAYEINLNRRPIQQEPA